MNLITIDDLYDDLKSNADNIIVINVLSAQSFEECHITGSINIPYAELPEKLNSIDKNKKVVVYCAHKDCPAAGDAYRSLEAAGFTNIFYYRGGMREWLQTDLKTEGICKATYLHELDRKE
jgi:rhodanese-related sulfurtransferase